MDIAVGEHLVTLPPSLADGKWFFARDSRNDGYLTHFTSDPFTSPFMDLACSGYLSS